MKNSIFLLALLLSACTQSRREPVPQIDEVIVRDRTDPHKLIPNARVHIYVLNLPANKEREITVRYLEIVDRKTTPVTVLHLPSVTSTNAANRNDMPLYRERLTVRFIDTVQKILQPVRDGRDTNRLGYSEIFATVATQLVAQAQRPAVQKRLYLYSDLQEHSALFDCYSKNSQQLLARHPGSVVSLFAAQQLLPSSLRGMTLFFIYEPRSRDDDLRYTRMLWLYRHLLEPLGATIIQQAQNRSFDGLE